MVLIFIHSFVNVSSFTCLLYFMGWAGTIIRHKTSAPHYFLNVLVPRERKCTLNRPAGTFSGIIFSSHSTVDLYILLHFNTLDSIASVTTLISEILSVISALLILWGLSNASSLLFIMQGQARVICLRALNFEW